jgi:hypothetical protein
VTLNGIKERIKKLAAPPSPSAATSSQTPAPVPLNLPVPPNSDIVPDETLPPTLANVQALPSPAAADGAPLRKKKARTATNQLTDTPTKRAAIGNGYAPVLSSVPSSPSLASSRKDILQENSTESSALSSTSIRFLLPKDNEEFVSLDLLKHEGADLVLDAIHFLKWLADEKEELVEENRLKDGWSSLVHTDSKKIPFKELPLLDALDSKFPQRS